MNPKQDAIQTLTGAILAEAQQEAQQILAEAEAKAADIRHRAEVQASSESAERLQLAEVEVQTLHTHTIAAAQLDAQTLKLQKREELLTEVFERVRQQLSALPQSEGYAVLVRPLTREAVENLSVEGDIVLRTDPATQALLDSALQADLGQELGVHLTAGSPLEQGTGIIAETPDGHRKYDNTLEARLARMQERLRAPVYRILMGETP
jgi:vacuolar-type H+-ATPase subunit E/Vma4